MDQSVVDELLFQINGKVEGVLAKLDSLTETLLRHESRISMLEKDVQNVKAVEPAKEDFKVEMLKLLAKCVLVSVSAVAALAGASELVTSILK